MKLLVVIHHLIDSRFHPSVSSSISIQPASSFTQPVVEQPFSAYIRRCIPFTYPSTNPRHFFLSVLRVWHVSKGVMFHLSVSWKTAFESSFSFKIRRFFVLLSGHDYWRGSPLGLPYSRCSLQRQRQNHVRSPSRSNNPPINQSTGSRAVRQALMKTARLPPAIHHHRAIWMDRAYAIGLANSYMPPILVVNYNTR